MNIPHPKQQGQFTRNKDNTTRTSKHPSNIDHHSVAVADKKFPDAVVEVISPDRPRNLMALHIHCLELQEVVFDSCDDILRIDITYNGIVLLRIFCSGPQRYNESLLDCTEVDLEISISHATLPSNDTVGADFS